MSEPWDETPTPPAGPIRARKAGLDTDSRSMPAIQARPRSITWPRIRAAFYFLLPYLIVIGVAISGALTLKGHTP